jgi:hypothetical protein
MCKNEKSRSQFHVIESRLNVADNPKSRRLKPPAASERARKTVDMNRAAYVAFLCLLAATPSLAQQSPDEGLTRPSLGLGEGFESAMASQFKTAFRVNDAQAKCLVYEVMTYAFANRDYKLTPVQIAAKVGDRCGLTLKAPR